jgi:TetR/AcrR family transcriptional regulator, regulator of biofilm formation and stress response
LGLRAITVGAELVTFGAQRMIGRLGVGAVAQRRPLRSVEVTIELIRREGVDAVAHRRVAEIAGVPLGSTTYYFSSRQDLLIRTFEHSLRQEVAATPERLGPIGSRRRSVGCLVDQLVAVFEPDFCEERWRTVALYALLTTRHASRS